MIAQRNGKIAASVLYALLLSLSACGAVKRETSAIDDRVTVARSSEANANALQVPPACILHLRPLPTAIVPALI
jgi:hypothetical protein